MPIYITPQKVKMRQLNGDYSSQFYGLDMIAENSITENIAAITNVANTTINTLNNVANTVQNWLDNHPEATTTVQDGAITFNKLNNTIQTFVTPEMYGAVGNGIVEDTNAFISAINSGKEIFLTRGKTYLLGELIFTNQNYNIIFHGCNAILKYKNSSNFITFNRSRYIYFYDCKFEGTNYTGNCITATADTYDWHFINCSFTNFDNALYGEKTFWSGYFLQCMFRSNNCHYKHIDQGASLISFNQCMFQGVREYITYFTANCKVLFDSCVIEGAAPTSGYVHYDTGDSGKIVFNKCYHEFVDGDYIVIYAPNGSEYSITDQISFRNSYIVAKNFHFHENLKYYGFNAIEYASGFNTPLNRVKILPKANEYYQEPSFYGFDWIKNNIDAKIAYLEITDTLSPITIAGNTRYGNELIYNRYADMTNDENKFFQLGIRNEMLVGHTIVCDYAFDGSTSSDEVLGFVLLNNDNWRSYGPNISPMQHTPNIIKSILNTAYSLSIRKKITGNDITGIRVYQLRNATAFKLKAIYII